LRRALPNLFACAATAAAMLAFAGCGGGERRDAGAPDGTYPATVTRASFAPEQRLAQQNTLVIAVRNEGEKAIPNLVVTVHGFTDGRAGARNADPARDLWIVDRGPAGAATAFDDTWAAGRLDPDATATLRWQLTPAVAGLHKLTYEIAPALAGPGRVELRGDDEAQGSLTVRVTDKPAKARVDPRTGEVQRQE
jgi:hypothetical protein